MTLKIVVDFQSAKGQRTGIGDYAANLVPTLQKLYPFCKFYLYQNYAEGLSTAGRIAWESLAIPIRSLKAKPDLVYSPGFACAYISAYPRVVTVHDIIGLVYPSNQGSVAGFYWGRWLPRCLRRADFLAVSSESTKKDLVRHLRIPEKKMRVVPCAARECFRKVARSEKTQQILSKYAIHEPYFIAVGTLEPRKNHLRLIQAYEKIKNAGSLNFSLLIVGKNANAAPGVFAYIKEKNLSESVRVIGYASDDDLVELYNASIGYASVSLYEGFGLPALEAMRCGKSGIISNVSSLPEIAGDTAVYVNPENVEEIARALKEYADNHALRASLEVRAYERAKKFNIENSAHEMMRIFESVAAASHKGG